MENFVGYALKEEGDELCQWIFFSLADYQNFFELASINFEPWRHDQAKICLADQHDWQQSQSYVTKS